MIALAGRLAELDAILMAKSSRGDGCWLWTGFTQPNGYGWINSKGIKIAAHRATVSRIVRGIWRQETA